MPEVRTSRIEVTLTGEVDSLLDPLAKLLEVYRVDGTSYRLVATHRGEDRVKAEPFEVFELELALLWSR